ncbi:MULTISPECIES: PaaI family thioesterase [Bradyrhizobium]|uniref:PaaI family thioesterase n=1 Tax=Bradyrhizobium TaxID=374 RepID=UPI000485C405|nr:MULTISPECIES: PaaI family thioesterase [Bradyrhizobium]UFW51185.1 PaaI family thioesterase [Bradyrhizobium arachidis]
MDEALVQELVAKSIGDGSQDFGSFFLSRFFGMAVAYEADACKVTMGVKPYMFNPQGSLHGGAIATALDISMGHLIKHQFGPGVTLEMKVQYFTPVRSGLLTCCATLLKRGRKTFFVQSSARVGDGEMIAHATSTWKLL